MIHPSPGFVIKTKYAKGDRREKVGNGSVKEGEGRGDDEEGIFDRF